MTIDLHRGSGANRPRMRPVRLCATACYNNQRPGKRLRASDLRWHSLRSRFRSPRWRRRPAPGSPAWAIDVNPCSRTAPCKTFASIVDSTLDANGRGVHVGDGTSVTVTRMSLSSNGAFGLAVGALRQRRCTSVGQRRTGFHLPHQSRGRQRRRRRTRAHNIESSVGWTSWTIHSRQTK
jgi:hypothetical protein